MDQTKTEKPCTCSFDETDGNQPGPVVLPKNLRPLLEKQGISSNLPARPFTNLPRFSSFLRISPVAKGPPGLPIPTYHLNCSYLL